MQQTWELITALFKLSENRTLVEDLWSSVTIKAEFIEHDYDLLHNVYKRCVDLGFENLLKVTLDDTVVDQNEFVKYYSTSTLINKWEVSFNKAQFLSKTATVDLRTNFFFKTANCTVWFDKLNPIDNDNPINEPRALKIIVSDLKEPFGSEYLYFVPISLADHSSIPKITSFPDVTRTQPEIHFLTDFKYYLNPQIWNITRIPTDTSIDLFQSLLKASFIALSCTIVDEFYSFKKVIINGLRRIVMVLYSDSDTVNVNNYKELKSIVEWIYEDKVVTRKKLFNERFTLDLEELTSVVANLKLHALGALNQAKDRYNFVILARKDIYLKELKELLKDLRTQSDLYSLKIRTLLNNFLRDVLAAVVLIGFTIFTKFTDNIGLDKNLLLKFVFEGLGIYYLISIFMQTVIDWTDIVITDKELKYWKNASKELIPESDFKKHYNQSLRPRRVSIWILYPVIGVLYLLISWSCFKYPVYFKKLVVPTNVQEHSPDTNNKNQPEKGLKRGEGLK
jgi:hypothetical protein